MNESNEQFSNVITPPPFSNLHSPDSYSVISISEIDFIISEIFEFYGRNKLKVVMVKYLEPVSACNGEMNEELKSLVA